MPPAFYLAPLNVNSVITKRCYSTSVYDLFCSTKFRISYEDFLIYFQTASSLLGCPVADEACVLYIISMQLSCAITEEQNTRGRTIHAPENTSQNFGILMCRKITNVSIFHYHYDLQIKCDRI